MILRLLLFIVCISSNHLDDECVSFEVIDVERRHITRGLQYLVDVTLDLFPGDV